MKRTATKEPPAHNVRLHGFMAQVARMQPGERAALSEAIERQTVAEIERGAIACRIKQARNEAGLTQPEMAEALGVIQRTYQNYESVKEPRTPWGLMNDIAKITGKTTEWLIHGDNAVASKTPDLIETLGADPRLERIESKLDELLSRPAAPTMEQILQELEIDANQTLARRRQRKQTRPPDEGKAPGSQS